MLRPTDPAYLAHAKALKAAGWRPMEQLAPGDILGAVRRVDTPQHVDVGTWQLLHLMDDLPVRGEVEAK